MTPEDGRSSDSASASSNEDLPLPQAPYNPIVNWGGSPPRMASARASAYSGKPSRGCRLGTSATMGSGSAKAGAIWRAAGEPHLSAPAVRRQRRRRRSEVVDEDVLGAERSAPVLAAGVLEAGAEVGADGHRVRHVDREREALRSRVQAAGQVGQRLQHRRADPLALAVAGHV